MKEIKQNPYATNGMKVDRMTKDPKQEPRSTITVGDDLRVGRVRKQRRGR